MTTPFPFVSGAILTAAQMNAITELPVNDKTASYTLTAAEAGERVIMNSASNTTITVNTSIFTAGQVIYITNKGLGVCTVTAGTATVSSTGSLALAQFASGVLYCISAGVFIFEAYGVGAAAAGLELVSTTTIGTTVSSVTVSGAFSSTYDNYLILVAGGTATVEGQLNMIFGAVTTNYYSSFEVRSWADFQFTSGAANAANLALVALIGANTLHGVITVANPNLAKVTVVTSLAVRATTGQTGGNMRGFLNDTTQHTAFTLTTSSGTMTGGTVKVYGYKN